MENLGRTLLFLGLGVAALGAVLWLVGKTGFKGLPGDLKFESDRVRVFLPLGTSIALSVLLSLGFWLWGYFRNK